LTYIRWGGFKAVLIADYEQLKLLAPFVLALLFLIFRRHTGSSTSDFDLLRIRATFGLDGAVLAPIFGVAWIVTSVDFYSRLNFPIRPPVNPQRKAFITIAMALTAIVFCVGAFYGLSMPAAVWRIHRPAEFTQAIVRWSLDGGSRATAIVMFASVFCMIFTTLNTLVITLLQVGRYRISKFPRLDNIHRILLSAIVASCALWPNSVSVIGVFIGSLLILPALAVFATLSDRVRAWLPRNFGFVWPALGAAVIGIVLVYPFAIDYERMHWATGVVVIAAVLFATAAKMIERKALK